MNKIIITPEIIEALRVLRREVPGAAFNTLDEAGFFAAIDAATPDAAPAAPAPAETATCDHCRGDYKPKKDGTLRPHTCWRYDEDLTTVVFGPLDFRGRGTKMANRIREAANQKS